MSENTLPENEPDAPDSYDDIEAPPSELAALMQPPASRGSRVYRFFKSIGLLTILLLVLGAAAAMSLWSVFFHHVPSGHMLIVISKFGEPLADGQVLAQPGQQGILEEVRGEGWHFIWPILYKTEIKPIVVVPGAKAGEKGLTVSKVGILKSLGGKPLPPGQFLADAGQQGIRRDVLLPGSYRMNPYGYEIKLVDMVEIKAGHVGVLRRKLGADVAGEFATKPTEKGIIRERVLQPGLYPINTEEYDVIPCEVGIYQTTYHYTTVEKENTALVFDAGDSNRIQLDCTIEWELKPEFWPVWLSKFRTMERIEATVIKPNVKAISRNKGQDYGAEEFLDGTKREKFQTDFLKELSLACKQDNVVIRHAFIRNIIIPESFLEPKRAEQLARETAITQTELRLTAETANEVAAAQQTIKLEVAKVEATTEKLVGAIDRETQNIQLVTDAQLAKLQDEYAAKVAIVEAQRKELIGKAEAEAKGLAGTARGKLFKMKMDIFGQDNEAFLRYTMAENLKSSIRLQLFQAGQGTFWTNLGDKNMNLVLPSQSR